jgi:membrane associated rhomboid family serine protease
VTPNDETAAGGAARAGGEPAVNAALPAGADNTVSSAERLQASAEPLAPPQLLEAEPPLVEFQRTLAAMTPRVYVSGAVVGINVLVFVLMVVSGVNGAEPTSAELVDWGANYGPQTLNGEWWRLLTCNFVHIGFVHLAFNMWAFAVTGPLVERIVGNVGFLLLYLASGICGSLASLFWNPSLVSAGASGAIFGVYGALLALLPLHRGTIPGEALLTLWKAGAAFVGYNLFFGMLNSHIDSAGHVGGLVAGLLCGIVLSQPIGPGARAGRMPRNFAVAGIGVCLALGGVAGLNAKYRGHAELGTARVRSGNTEVLYTGGATEEETQRLAEYLQRRWRAVSDPAPVHLEKTDNGYRFRMMIKKDSRESLRTQRELEFLAARISRDVLGGAAVEANICDENFATVKVLPPRADIRFGVVESKAEVFFGTDVDRADARRLAEYFASVLTATPEMASFKLGRRGDVVLIHVTVAPEEAKDPEFVAAMRGDRDDIAAKVFPGRAVEMILYDRDWTLIGVVDR